jgi:hypothetical protein
MQLLSFIIHHVSLQNMLACLPTFSFARWDAVVLVYLEVIELPQLYKNSKLILFYRSFLPVFDMMFRAGGDCIACKSCLLFLSIDSSKCWLLTCLRRSSPRVRIRQKI